MKRILIAIIIIILASFLASQKPDGLDSVSELFGFSTLAIERDSIMAGYNVSFFKKPWLSTVTAGFAGLIIIYCFFMLVKFLSQCTSFSFFKSWYRLFKKV